MAINSKVFEKMGTFYLGRPYDLDGKKGLDEPLLYDSRDLLTHAVCIGMTGSGKTGLCLAMLEEAALDDIPAIIIDPKGDLADLLLTFPDLRPEDFRPWINEEDARREGLEADAYAAQQAEVWRQGLEAWGQNGERIRQFRSKTELEIYTPGSNAGIPINVIGSFSAPGALDDEALAARVQTATSSLLGLIGIDADPVKSRESVFISAILNHEWKEGRSLDIARLIALIQHPSFKKIGVLDVEAFYPAKERFSLVTALNTLLASPGFAVWQQGVPLDIKKFLYNAQGKPKLSIFSIAHLPDTERMFFVSMLLNEVVAWMHTQSGTTSLRAIIYMDEIFGFFPPTANPPSKLPLLRLLKQGRAFGIGVMLATQNPADLDYKGLSNAGTWFIGRLQTERDRARVLEGLRGATANNHLDSSRFSEILSALRNRIFLMNNVHDDYPVTFETRWTMSYLRGPLTKSQIKTLVASQQEQLPQDKLVSYQSVQTPNKASFYYPTLLPQVPQVFVRWTAEEACTYEPKLLGAAVIVYSDARLGIEQRQEIILGARVPEGASSVDWESAEKLEVRLDALEKIPVPNAQFSELPDAASHPKNYAIWEKEFKQWLGSNQSLNLFHCPSLKLVSASGETEGEFKARVRLAAHEQRDQKIEALRKKYAAKVASLQQRLERAQSTVTRKRGQAQEARMQTFISMGSTLLGAFLGRKGLGASTLGRATTAARGVSRSFQRGAEVSAAEESAEDVRRQIDDLQSEFDSEVGILSSSITNPHIEILRIKPSRTSITVRLLALGWLAQK